jgi:hypothetical protein
LIVAYSIVIIHTIDPQTPVIIEKSIKTYKSHCKTRDFDVKFVGNLKLDAVKVEFVKKVENKIKSSF